jgi:hypothetical protein
MIGATSFIIIVRGIGIASATIFAPHSYFHDKRGIEASHHVVERSGRDPEPIS